MADRVPRSVLGATFRMLRCNFDTEVSRQCHGDDTIVVVRKSCCCDNPGFRVCPSPLINKAEKTWRVPHSLSYAIAYRAQLGPSSTLASTLLGYAEQSCWVCNTDAKANALRAAAYTFDTFVHTPRPAAP
jgi:hypothetical protein